MYISRTLQENDHGVGPVPRAAHQLAAGVGGLKQMLRDLPDDGLRKSRENPAIIESRNDLLLQPLLPNTLHLLVCRSALLENSLQGLVLVGEGSDRPLHGATMQPHRPNQGVAPGPNGGAADGGDAKSTALPHHIPRVQPSKLIAVFSFHNCRTLQEDVHQRVPELAGLAPAEDVVPRAEVDLVRALADHGEEVLAHVGEGPALAQLSIQLQGAACIRRALQGHVVVQLHVRGELLQHLLEDLLCEGQGDTTTRCPGAVGIGTRNTEQD
mmetsp:Transcript_16235/g.38551  ORF Transcript_16235/g.38551 Transcript_16235/m.38551 type:complete len:269 (-) Transcript_16235:2547-3353(-)